MPKVVQPKHPHPRRFQRRGVLVLGELHQRRYPEYRGGPKYVEGELLSSCHPVQTYTPREQQEDGLRRVPRRVHALAPPEGTLMGSLGEEVRLLGFMLL